MAPRLRSGQARSFTAVRRGRLQAAHLADRLKPSLTYVLLIALSVAPQPVMAATLQSETVRAWDTYVAATERRIESELGSSRGFLVSDFLARRSPGEGGANDGPSIRKALATGAIAIDRMPAARASAKEIETPSSLLSHWRGSVFLAGLSLDSLLQRLQHPREQGPHQEDVLALRVLDRAPDRLSLFIRMTRTKIVTVTYDTEHQVTYRRHGPQRASSRSVATRIAELDDEGHAKPEGHDRGFLWRMNSYWRYEQVPGGVIVELESLTLSRDIPLGLGHVVGPIVNRIARESMSRTLDSLRRSHQPADRPHSGQMSRLFPGQDGRPAKRGTTTLQSSEVRVGPRYS
jgi:hypothetical protein